MADQRGKSRPAPGQNACDIGAFELYPSNITVNNLTDPLSTSGNGFCTLREAINNANSASDSSAGDCAAGTGDDSISFSVTGGAGAVSINSPLPVQKTVTIDGTGENITIDGHNAYQILQVQPGAALTLNSLTIANGFVDGGNGGAVENAGTLTITNSTVTGNSSLYANGTGGYGGAIDNEGDATLTVGNSTFSSNSTSFGGGGIAGGFGAVTISDSTFTKNSANLSIDGSGGAVYCDGSGPDTLTVTNSTFSLNTAG